MYVLCLYIRFLALNRIFTIHGSRNKRPKELEIGDDKRFLKQANSHKLFPSKAIARKMALSKTARFYFEDIIDST